MILSTRTMVKSDKHLDRKYMRLALSLARKGSGKVFPNPMVGCVMVKDGRIVGKGYHEYFGGPHAEINALAQAGSRARGSTMYVSLEPCNHYGKTPPCTDAIIRAGVRRVVAATLDPDEKARGKGVRMLRNHSIAVAAGLMKQEAERLNAQYRQSRQSKSTAVIVKAAMSADGKIATRTGDSKWITSEQARSYVHGVRSTVDAIVVGRNTVVRDNPRLTSHGVGSNPVRVIIDPHLTIPLKSNVLNDEAPTIIMHAGKVPRAKLESLRKKRIITVALPYRRGKMNFNDVIAKLKQFSLNRILIEGGGETIAAALDSGVGTDLILFIAPTIIGGRSAISPVEGLGAAFVRNSIKLRNPRITRIGPDFMLTAKIHRR